MGSISSEKFQLVDDGTFFNFLHFYLYDQILKILAYRGYHAYSPPLWQFFLVKKGGVTNCVTGKLKKIAVKKGGVTNGATGSLKKNQANKKGGVN